MPNTPVESKVAELEKILNELKEEVELLKTEIINLRKDTRFANSLIPLGGRK